MEEKCSPEHPSLGNEGADRYIASQFHSPECSLEETPGTEFFGAERTTGGECGVIFTVCHECGQVGKHHFSLAGHPTYRELKDRLRELGVADPAKP